MYKVLVFAGTTEGYELCRFLGKQKISVCALVATEYGTSSPGGIARGGASCRAYG